MPNSKNRIAVYPGSFDPPTLGHLDIVFRAAKMFERVLVAVADNPAKKHTFSAQERLEMVRGAIKKIPNAEADVFSGLLVDYLRKKGIQVLIRGLRVVSDMDYEFQLASFNRTLYPDVETVFLMPDERYTYFASSMVKEVARLGASADSFVLPDIAKKLKEKFEPGRD